MAMSEQEPQTSPRLETESAFGAGADGDVFFVTLQYRGTPYGVPVQAEDVAATIFDFVHEVLDFPQENCKLIFRGKTTRLDDAGQITVGDMGLSPGSKLMLLASSAQDVAFVKNIRADPLVKGFAEEERDERNRRKRARAAGGSAWGTKQDPEYRFGSIKAEFKYSQPPPYEAEKLLERLATDPGIIEIMKTRRFKVGVFTEMSPVEAQERMAKRGTPNMDLLGYNMNSGDMIVLRLRTDTLKGFRPYHDLINTLIHELTHNVWSEHDHNFWKLFGELKAQYMRFHRFWSHGGQAADSNASQGQFGEFNSGMDAEDASGTGAGFGHVLGGASASDATVPAPATEAERRERALLAAEARKVGTEPPVRNFLASTGTWVVVCPCGQVHDPGDCPNGGAAPAADNEDDDDEDESMLKPLKRPPPVADGSPEPVAVESATASAPAVESATNNSPTAHDSGGTAVPADGDGAALVPSAAPLDEHADVAMAPESDTTEMSAPIQQPCAGFGGEQDPGGVPPEVAAAPALDVADLEALGLDGAAVWLQRFAGRLQSFKKGGGSSSVALELLLRLVRNVNNNPHEPKFRRIRADNPRVRADLLRPGLAEEAEALMSLLGFESSVEASGEKVFAIRDATFDSVRLRMGQELLESEMQVGSVKGGA